MNDTISLNYLAGSGSVPSNKKVYYAVKRGAGLITGYSGTANYFDDSRTLHYTRERRDAAKFTSVTDAILDIAKRVKNYGGGHVTGGDTLNIVKITETPGTETRRVLTDCECPKAGETVKFAVYGTRGGGFSEGSTTAAIFGFTSSDRPESAKLYDSLQDAVNAIVTVNTARRGYPDSDVTVKRIAVSSGTPTITEEVLG